MLCYVCYRIVCAQCSLCSFEGRKPACESSFLCTWYGFWLQIAIWSWFLYIRLTNCICWFQVDCHCNRKSGANDIIHTCLGSRIGDANVIAYIRNIMINFMWIVWHGVVSQSHVLVECEKSALNEQHAFKISLKQHKAHKVCDVQLLRIGLCIGCWRLAFCAIYRLNVDFGLCNHGCVTHAFLLVAYFTHSRQRIRQTCVLFHGRPFMGWPGWSVNLSFFTHIS